MLKIMPATATVPRLSFTGKNHEKVENCYGRMPWFITQVLRFIHTHLFSKQWSNLGEYSQ